MGLLHFLMNASVLLRGFLCTQGHQTPCYFLLLSPSQMSMTCRSYGCWCFRICGHSLLLSLGVNAVRGFWILLSSCSDCIYMEFQETPNCASVTTAHPYPHPAHQKPHLLHMLNALAHKVPRDRYHFPSFAEEVSLQRGG